MDMGPIAKAFVRDYLDALPEGMTKDDPASMNTLLGVAIGIAFEKALDRIAGNHFHYHVPEGSVLAQEGSVIIIEPLQLHVDRLNAEARRASMPHTHE
jgi:hypothetical protein